ncbi:MAG: hypothetical protein ACPIOQ_33520 [Promethearchaeia archaeon]
MLSVESRDCPPFFRDGLGFLGQRGVEPGSCRCATMEDEYNLKDELLGASSPHCLAALLRLRTCKRTVRVSAKRGHAERVPVRAAPAQVCMRTPCGCKHTHSPSCAILGSGVRPAGATG